ncbi:MAG TPA: FCD domain-containing protein [Acidimicrobiales bacterium]
MAAPRPIPRRSLTDQVADALVDLIRERGLRSGDALPATADLSESFNVSRPVVREAVAQLAGRGLLVRQQGRESVVTVPGSEHLEQLLRYRIEGSGVSDDVLQDYRETLEAAAARLAARNATEDDLAALRERFAELCAAQGDDALHDADVAFHRAVAVASHNELILLTLDAVASLIRQLRRRAWSGWKAAGKGLQPVLDAHERILDAITRGDEHAAAEAMVSHLAQARAGVAVGAPAAAGERDGS